MEGNSIKTKYDVKDIVQIALMAAVIFAATKLTGIPVGLGYKGVVHVGDSMVFIAAIILSRRNAFFASAIGMSLFDILSTAPMWTPFTFVIKGIMAYIAASIAYKKNYNGNNIIINLVGCILGGIWMIGAYYFSGAFLDHYLMKFPWNQCFILQATHIAPDVAQVVVGIIIALPISKILKKANVIR
ncbi:MULTISPECIES: ECF transporter S component [Clostridium]|uniref:ECF transporter S component n=1 Tax=Clostridium TaxID=1485 RepID=UPI00082600E2|nr:MULTISPECIES: ECF transporter S component [Clostridium]PJI07720.1 BioY family transporter [Clostridium sp. CT7]